MEAYHVGWTLITVSVLDVQLLVLELDCCCSLAVLENGLLPIGEVRPDDDKDETVPFAVAADFCESKINLTHCLHALSTTSSAHGQTW